MIIGITANFTPAGVGISGKKGAHYEAVGQLAALHPEHRFHLFYSTPAEGFQPRFPSNVVLQKKPGYKHPLLQKLWYDVQLTRLLKKHQADVFLSMEGFCSQTSKVTQCLLIPGGFASEELGERKKRGERFYHWLLPGFLSRASSAIAGSHRQKEHLENLYGDKGKKLEVVYGGIGAATGVLSAEAKARVRQQYSEGMEYFIYEGPISTRKVLPVLKAFSLFKKRQQTAWKLVLCPHEGGMEKGFHQLMSTYKYRQDVVLAGSLNEEERSGLQGAAYGAIDPDTDHQSIASALAWMERGVPYMAASNNPVVEIGPDAALFFNAENPADIAEKFMQLYKDEALHGALTEKGVALATEYSWRRTADQIWENLLRLQSRQQ